MRSSAHRARRTSSTLLVLALTAGLTAITPAATATHPTPAADAVRAPAVKPYMGWTSWSMQSSKYPGLNPDGDYSYLTEKNVLKQADALAAKLKPYGYEYVNIDAGWWRDMDWKPRFDGYGRQAADPGRFPRGMKAVADDLHAEGLKAGIYLPVGLEKEAYGEGKVPLWNAEGCTTADIVHGDLRTTNGWDSAYKIDFSRPCAQKYIDSQARLFADWGYDFLKLDGVGPGSFKSGENYDNVADVAAWQKAIAATGGPCQSSSVKSRKGARRWAPVLLTRMSIGPARSSIRATAAATAAESVTSKASARTDVPKVSANSLRALSRATVSRPLRTTVQPASRSPAASARPMPRLDPVTRATLAVTSKRGWLTRTSQVWLGVKRAG